MKKSKEERQSDLIEELVTLTVQNHRWPVQTDISSDGKARRLFGTWNAAKLAARDEFVKRYGFPDWDLRLPNHPRTRNEIQKIGAIEAFESAIEKAVAYPPTKPIVPKQSVKHSPVELHVLISDVHVGEYIDPDLASGCAGPDGYNLDVFNRCADLHEEKILFFTELYRHVWKVDKLVVNFLGDIVTGEQIFLGQALQIDRILADQVMIAANRFASMFYNWAQHFKEVEVFCVPGNHGRLGKKGELHWRSNMDYMSSLFIRERLRAQKNVSVFVSHSPNMIVQHGNYNWLLHHGDHVSGGNNANNFVPIERKVRALSQMTSVPIHFSASGHLHKAGSQSMANGGRILRNGSYPGGTQFSVDVCSDAQVPAQKIWLYEPDRGLIFAENDVYLGDRVTLKQDENRIFTGYEGKKR